MGAPNRKMMTLLRNTASIYLERVIGLCPTVSRHDVRMLCWACYQIGREEARTARIEDIKLFEGKDDDEI